MELVVVMAIFLFVIGAALIIFLSIIENQRSILVQIQTLNQVSYAQEYMSKALRMAKRQTSENCIEDGFIYLLTRPDGSGTYRGVKFLNQSIKDADGNPQCQEFYIGENKILYEVEWANGSASTPVPLVSQNMQLEEFYFSVNGLNIRGGAVCQSPCGANTDQANPVQPRITIVLKTKNQAFQTTVSQRNLNVF